MVVERRLDVRKQHLDKVILRSCLHCAAQGGAYVCDIDLRYSG